ncbi:cation:dicarboxylase symporter family transporter, partial [Bacillus sp. S1-R1J2-FB]|uniref:cation:dicarboxylate symporter family transporter n=1 Tax=Bacillus sp. S1-R1J2-FB TaxID=1973494 RepID=UPI000A381EF7
MRIVKNLTLKVIVAIICGIVVGSIWPSVGQEMKPIGETFINMIKMVIARIIFLTIVLGIASMGSMKKVGRVDGKALLYFEIVTTAALNIGIIVANDVRPAYGL